MRFNDNLRNLRIQRNMTQLQLARDLGTSQSAVAAWENAAREPDFKTIQKIADYFGVTMSSLLPSDDSVEDSLVNMVADSLHQNPKLRLLFDRSKFLSDADLDAVLAVVSAISRERGD